MLVPHGDDDYYRSRPTLAIPRPGAAATSSVKLNDFYALHPGMKPLARLFHEGRLGFVQAVGSDNPTGSHFDTQDQVEHGEAYGHSLGGGWRGRHLRARVAPAAASGALSAVAIGASLPESLRGAPVASAFRSIDEIQLPRSSEQASVIARALSDLYATEVGLLADQGEQTLRLLARVETLRGKPYVPNAGGEYAADGFSSALREIARVVKADLGLEVACVDLTGWDTHFLQSSPVGGQAGPIDSLARGLAAFDADLTGCRDRVIVIVMTEFGRRLYDNGSAGTDHGRGFAFMALGEQISGGQIHGAYPGLKKSPSLPAPGEWKFVLITDPFSPRCSCMQVQVRRYRRSSLISHRSASACVDHHRLLPRPRPRRFSFDVVGRHALKTRVSSRGRTRIGGSCEP